MQHGASNAAIVQDLRNHPYYRRGRVVTEMKQAAHQRHRSRVKAHLRLVARGAMDAEDFDDRPLGAEALDPWDVW